MKTSIIRKSFILVTCLAAFGAWTVTSKAASEILQGNAYRRPTGAAGGHSRYRDGGVDLRPSHASADLERQL